MDKQIQLERESKIYKTFLVSVILTVALCLSGIFLGMSLSTKKIMHEELLARARTDFNNIMITREWNARYGGVYVEKKARVETNPFLENPEIRTIDGKIYTKRNPALMTREISEIAKRQGNYSFHITSLDPLNPENKPDHFEEDSLHRFEAGEKENYREEVVNGRNFFRYMAPLFVKQPCMQCHAKQGYRINDIRGGISVSFDIEDFQNKVRLNATLIALFALTTTAFTLLLVWFYTARLIQKIALARERIQEMAITDELTKIFNRRQVIARFEEEFNRSRRLQKNLSCIMLDIDLFKRVNDTYGHQAGDEVLKQVAAITNNSLRTYDILGRFGGEEFLMVLPETAMDDAIALAERIREKIKKVVVMSPANLLLTDNDSAKDSGITVSLGVAQLQASDKSIDDMIKRSDENLYRAKQAGRDRVC